MSNLHLFWTRYIKCLVSKRKQMKNILYIGLIVFFGSYSLSSANDRFRMKEVKDFQTLKQFKGIDEFDKYIDTYVQICLDNGYGGAGSLPCLVKYDLWDRELNIYYKKLYQKLDKQGKKLLKSSQRKWLIGRDSSREITSYIIDKINDGEGGTAQILIGGMFANDTLSPIIKSRVVLLKDWLELLDADTKIHE